jgi:hypothetical protein
MLLLLGVGLRLLLLLRGIGLRLLLRLLLGIGLRLLLLLRGIGLLLLRLLIVIGMLPFKFFILSRLLGVMPISRPIKL